MLPLQIVKSMCRFLTLRVSVAGLSFYIDKVLIILFHISYTIFLFSVVKATGTFYPSSHLHSNASSPSPRSINDSSPAKDSKMPRLDLDQKPKLGYDQKMTGPTIPPSCHDQACPLNKTAGGMNLHYHCPHCGQAYVDLKLLFGHMIKKHNPIEAAPIGLAATKVSL